MLSYCSPKTQDPLTSHLSPSSLALPLPGASGEMAPARALTALSLLVAGCAALRLRGAARPYVRARTHTPLLSDAPPPPAGGSPPPPPPPPDGSATDWDSAWQQFSSQAGAQPIKPSEARVDLSDDQPKEGQSAQPSTADTFWLSSSNRRAQAEDDDDGGTFRLAPPPQERLGEADRGRGQELSLIHIGRCRRRG